VYAAGSLREALTVIASEYEARTGQKIALTFGASGLLRERIEKGEPAQVFASADVDHPQRLASRGGWQAPTVFVRNALCALTSDRLSATPATVLATLLQPDVRLGTSTPKADPAGDYAWALFRKAEGVQAGAYARLDAKALKLTGGADSPKPPAGRSSYGWVMDAGQADVFLAYCTNAVAAQKEVARLKVVQLPPELQVSVAYGVTVRSAAPPSAAAFAQGLLAPPAQAVFQRFGFARP
jgi:ABC-type molybdate transport system substrate-binding protein